MGPALLPSSTGSTPAFSSTPDRVGRDGALALAFERRGRGPVLTARRLPPPPPPPPRPPPGWGAAPPGGGRLGLSHAPEPHGGGAGRRSSGGGDRGGTRRPRLPDHSLRHAGLSRARPSRRSGDQHPARGRRHSRIHSRSCDPPSGLGVPSVPDGGDGTREPGDSV